MERFTQEEVKGFVDPLCQLLGYSRQAYYKRRDQMQLLAEEDVLLTSIVLYCQYLRHSNNLPHAGFRELLCLSQACFGPRFIIGRDRFCDLLRANGLMLCKRRVRPRTTNSRYTFFKFEGLLNTDPKFVPTKPGELMVADIQPQPD